MNAGDLSRISGRNPDSSKFGEEYAVRVEDMDEGSSKYSDFRAGDKKRLNDFEVLSDTHQEITATRARRRVLSILLGKTRICNSKSPKSIRMCKLN